jgi:methyl-accepting chemotaxis protein
MFQKFEKASLTQKMIILNLGSFFLIFVLVHVYILPTIESMFIDSYKMKIRNAVEIADSLIADLYKKSQEGEYTEEEAKNRALTRIKNLRYNDTEYFWIHDLDLKMIMHATQSKLDGTDISQKKDPNGLALFAEMNVLVKKSGEGFLRYLWPKPGSDAPVEKYSYVKLFRPWGWVTGNGIYFDQIYSMVMSLRIAIYGGLSLAVILSCVATILFSKRLVRRFEDAVDSLKDAGNEMSTLSHSLSETGHKVAEGVSSSASSITETSASMEEIGLMSQRNADHSSMARTSAGQCLGATLEGKKIIAETVSCMNDIALSNKEVLNQNKNSADKIKHITLLIKGIEEKTKVIHDIVFQTKLLSFNASVEAARAGELGKGFSIVAEEVGNLANMSGKAAKEIQESLDQSITEVEIIVKENLTQSELIIASATTKVEVGLNSVKDCEAVFDKILSQVTGVVDLTDQISSSCHEQKTGFDQINKAILQLNTASTTNAKVSEEVSASVEKIVGQAFKVQSLSSTISELVKGDVA